MKPLLSFILLFSFFTVVGVSPYDWEKERKRIPLTTQEAELNELLLTQHSEFNYRFEGDELVMDNILHRIIYVNNSEAIQKHNRLKIPMSGVIELLDVRARTITKGGKVILFDKSNLKEIKDEESGNAFKIFALEGIEVGSEVEYYIVKKMQVAVFNNVALQMDIPVKKVSFTLRSPSHLKFDFKSYWGSPEVKASTEGDVNVYSVAAENIPGLEEEPLSFFDASRQRIEFKLAYNTARSNARLNTWETAAKTFFGVITQIEKSDEKALQQFVTQLKDDANQPLPKRIRNIERKVKSTIQINEETQDKDLSQIGRIVKMKVATGEGMTKLFYQIFTRLGIETNIVVTCNREYSKFDEHFDSWAYLDEYLIYFPQSKSFLSPYSSEYINPLIPYHFTAQKGLFIEPIALGGVVSGLGTIGEIPALSDDVSFDNLEIDVDFAADLESNSIHVSRKFGGYPAAYITPYYDLMSEEEKLSMVEDLLKQTAPDLKIKTWKGNTTTDGPTDHFTMDVSYETSHFIEKAGPRILLKAGLVIGPQIEMYRDDKRKTIIENDFNRRYDRKIRIKIPEGYTVKNPNDLNMNVVYKDGDKVSFAFVSRFTMEANSIVIDIEEFYKEIYAPVERYEDYRKVINASADFNKVTLVLEKKK
jgi:hypothetical protein